MAVKLGTANAIYQKTEVFDTAGNHTWTHPLPGQNIEVFVELYGAGGGSQASSGAATDGGDTTWDTAGTAVTASGGNGADVASPTTSGLNGAGLYNMNGFDSTGNSEDNFITNGSNHYGASSQAGYAGNVGNVNRFNVVANNDINLTVGVGGSGNRGNGKSGAIIVSYNITTTQTPVVANLQRRDWEHFGMASWRVAANAATQNVTRNTLTTLTLDTEVLDTGNKLVVNGDDTFNLEAGTYDFNIHVPYFVQSQTTSGVIRLWNVTDGSLAYSKTLAAVYGPQGAAERDAPGVIVVPSNKAFRLEIFYGGTTTTMVVGSSDVNQPTLTDVTDRTSFSFKWRA